MSTYLQELSLSPEERKQKWIHGPHEAFRAEMRRYLLPFPNNWVYDSWLALVLSAFAPAAAVCEPMNLWRQHGRNSGKLGVSCREEAIGKKADFSRWGLEAANSGRTELRKL